MNPKLKMDHAALVLAERSCSVVFVVYLLVFFFLLDEQVWLLFNVHGICLIAMANISIT